MTSEAGFAAGEVIALRPGVALPDWSLAPDSAARAALVDSMAVAGRRTKWADLTAEEDALWRAVLRGFAEDGAPGLSGLSRATGQPLADIRDRLAALRRRDLLVLDAAGEVVAAYPFSATPTPHRVTLRASGATRFALCAIDALGMGAMLGTDTLIASSCAACGAAIRIETRDGGRRLRCSDSVEAIVWSGIRYAGGCAATSGCALKLFFCSDEHLAQWRAGTDPQGHGHRLTAEAAMQAGMALFVPMLVPAAPAASAA